MIVPPKTFGIPHISFSTLVFFFGKMMASPLFISSQPLRVTPSKSPIFSRCPARVSVTSPARCQPIHFHRRHRPITACTQLPPRPPDDDVTQAPLSSTSEQEITTLGATASSSDPDQTPFRPKSSSALLKRPESVLALVTVTMLSTAAYMMRATQRVRDAITSRIRQHLETQRLEARLRARQREREFLSSALAATRATLQNTEAYVAVQRTRADNAEEKLNRLEAMAKDLRDVERRRDSLRAELNYVETALNELEIDNAKNIPRSEQEAVQNASAARGLRNQLEQLNVNYEDVLQQVKDKRAEHVRVQALNDELGRKNNQVHNVAQARQLADEKRQKEENQVKNLETNVSSTMQLVEEQRRQIEAVSSGLERTSSLLKQKRDRLKELEDPQMSGGMPKMHVTISKLDEEAVKLQNMLDEKSSAFHAVESERTELNSQLTSADNRLQEMKFKVLELEQMALKQKSSSAPLSVAASDALDSRTTTDRDNEHAAVDEDRFISDGAESDGIGFGSVYSTDSSELAMKKKQQTSESSQKKSRRGMDEEYAQALAEIVKAKPWIMPKNGIDELAKKLGMTKTKPENFPTDSQIRSKISRLKKLNKQSSAPVV